MVGRVLPDNLKRNEKVEKRACCERYEPKNFEIARKTVGTLIFASCVRTAGNVEIVDYATEKVNCARENMNFSSSILSVLVCFLSLYYVLCIFNALTAFSSCFERRK